MIVSIAAIAVLALAVLGLRLLSRLEQELDDAPEGAGQALTRAAAEEAQVLYYNGEKYQRRQRLTTVLILGIDDETPTERTEPRADSQADLLVLAVFDPGEKTCKLIQLDRDTMTEIQALDTFGTPLGLKTEQLALAHTYGDGLNRSCENTVEAVSRLLYGEEIQRYVALTMDAIPVLNDLVGGVVVTVEDDFTGVDETLKRGETLRLTEENVENFVRARSAMPEDPTNRNRMRRQRVYLAGLWEALRASLADDPGFVYEAYAALADSLVSNCTVNELNDYARRFSAVQTPELLVPEGELVRGAEFMEFYADEEALQALVLDTFYLPAE